MVARTLTSAQLAALTIPTAEQVAAAAARLPQLELGTATHWDARPGVFLEVGAGLLRTFRSSAHLRDAATDRALGEQKRRHDFQLGVERVVKNEPMSLLKDWEVRRASGEDPPSKDGKRITRWTGRSRARMRMQLNRLDFNPLFEDGLEPAMVTLTMPGRWEHLAPTPAAFKAIVNRFASSYRSAWDAPIRGVWKLEYQRRGAPHLHILMTPPAGVARHGDPVDFATWLSIAWPRACKTDADQLVAHRYVTARPKTISYVGDQYLDPRRISGYFEKHGYFDAKEYQNRMPQLWLDAIEQGATGARFWGSWGLGKASAVLQLDDRGAASVEAVIDPLGIARAVSDVIAHYQRLDDGTWVLVEERQLYATDRSVLRAAQRAIDDAGSSSSDAVRAERFMRKLSASLYMRGQKLERNEHGQLVLPRGKVLRDRQTVTDRDTGEIRTVKRYRVGYYRGGSGYLIVPDGTRAAAQLQRVLDRRETWVAAA